MRPDTHPLADGLRMTAHSLREHANWLEREADEAQKEWEYEGDAPSIAVVRMLERERDEARREAREVLHECQQNFEALRKTLLQRDEARNFVFNLLQDTRDSAPASEEADARRRAAHEAVHGWLSGSSVKAQEADPRPPHTAARHRGEGSVEQPGGGGAPPATPGCRCTATEVCFACRDREAHRAPEPVTAVDPALLVPGSVWRDPDDGEIVRLVERHNGKIWLAVSVVEGNRLRRAPGKTFHVGIDSGWQRVSTPPEPDAPDVEPATDEHVEVLAELVDGAPDGSYGITVGSARKLIARALKEEARSREYARMLDEMENAGLAHKRAADAYQVERDRMKEERDEARGWVKLLLAPYAGDGVREEARLAIARWDGKQEATDAGEAG